MKLGSKGRLLLEIRRLHGTGALLSTAHQLSLNAFRQAMFNDTFEPARLAEIASRDSKLTTVLLELANAARRDMNTPLVTSLQKAIARLGKLGCIEALSQVKLDELRVGVSKEWTGVIEVAKRVIRNACERAKVSANENVSANPTDAMMLTSLASAGLIALIYAADNIDLPIDKKTLLTVLEPNEFVTEAILISLKVPAEVVDRIAFIFSDNPTEVEARIAKSSWREVTGNLENVIDRFLASREV